MGETLRRSIQPRHSLAQVYFKLDVTPFDHVQRALVRSRFEIMEAEGPFTE
jgi:hypothetical protein